MKMEHSYSKDLSQECTDNNDDDDDDVVVDEDVDVVVDNDDELNTGDENLQQNAVLPSDSIISSLNRECELELLKMKVKELQNKIDKIVKELAKERKSKRQILKAKRKQELKLTGVFNSDQLMALGRISNRGSKWSNKTVKKALQLRFACGATGYQLLLSQGQPLPSMRTLRRRMEVVEFRCGILEDVFKFMKLKVSSMQENEKICSLTLDEMSISPGIDYDIGSGELLGDASIEDPKGAKSTATHALVLMLCGISTRWKQTVAYHFTGNSICPSALHTLILDIIERTSTIGLHVISVTSDMGSSNQAMWRTFGIICSKYSQTVNKIVHPCDSNSYLYFLADVPHIIKNLKAAIVNGNVITLPTEVVDKFDLYSNKVSKEAFEVLEKFQRNSELKLAPKLTESILKPSHFEKMKVGNALNFFSHSVSCGLRYLVQKEGYSNSLLTTAWFIDLVNRWFNLMSSRHPVMALSKFNDSAYADAIQHLNDTIWVFNRITYGKNWKPVQTGVVLSTTSMLDIQENLLNRGYKFVLTSRFTQDCLENLFSCVRLKNPVPSTIEFKYALKMISVAQFLKNASTTSYQDDENEYLAEFLDLKSLSNKIDEESSYVSDLNLENLEEIDTSSSDISPAEIQSLYHLAGYCVAQVCKRNSHCENCVKDIKSSEECNEEWSPNDLTDLKEYKKGCLNHPSRTCFELLKYAEELFRSTKKNEDFTSKKNLLDVFVRTVIERTSNLETTCHDIKKKLLTHYFRVRIQIYSKIERNRRKQEIKSSEQTLGSKSMAMRTVVKKIK